ncbi:hypothetical protein [Actinomadura harenae]|nr:hypothetical protein [Actinomadura harenae]
MITRVVLALLLRVLALLPNPPREPLKKCACGTSNEPDRTSCIGCGGPL